MFLAAEFPNDNPALHAGVIWVCLDPTRPPVAERTFVPEVEPQTHAVDGDVEDDDDLDAAAAIVVEELEPFDDVPLEVVAIEPMPASEPMPTFAPPIAADAGGGLAVVAEHALAPRIEAAPPATLEIAANDYAPRDSTELPAAPDDAFTSFLCVLADVAVSAGSPFVASLVPALFIDGRIDGGLPEASRAALESGGALAGCELSPSFSASAHAWRAVLRGTSEDLPDCGGMMLDEWAADLLARLLGAPDRAVALRRELRTRGVAAFGLIDAA